MGRINRIDTDESDSTYENKEGGSGRSSSSVSLEEEASTSNSGRLGVRCDQRKGMIEGELEARMQEGGRKGDAGQGGREAEAESKEEGEGSGR